MTTFCVRVCALLLVASAAVLRGQVAELINFEGRVAVNGVNFDGPGKFKFALVEAGGAITYWSNDGTSTAGSEPAVAVAITVRKGLYSVLLGDTTLPNMAAIPGGVFKNSGVLLRVWFNDGRNGSQLLTPDQSLAAPAEATPANTPHVRVPGGTACDAWQERANRTPPEARHDHTVVWTGSEMIVWGGYNNAPIPNNGGRYTPAVDSWSPMATSGAPAARLNHTAVWTGSVMIVRGGYYEANHVGNYFNDTFSYTPDCGGFNFTSVFLNGGILSISFPTVRGITYSLWCSESLATGSWIDTGFTTLGNGASRTLTVPAPAAGVLKRFYRLQASP